MKRALVAIVVIIAIGALLYSTVYLPLTMFDFSGNPSVNKTAANLHNTSQLSTRAEWHKRGPVVKQAPQVFAVRPKERP